jgi:hypothetical protein
VQKFHYQSWSLRTDLNLYASINTYSVVSIKKTGCNKRTGWAEFFSLLHEKRVQGGGKIFLLHEK